VLWNNSLAVPNTVSINSIVEEHSDYLKNLYLGWVYATGQSVVAGKTVIEHLELRPKLSFWWMSSIAQKYNISDTSLINDAIKLLAFEQFILNPNIRKINVFSDRKALAKPVYQLCSDKNIEYSFNKVNPKLHSPKNFYYKKFIIILQSLLCLLGYALKIKRNNSIPSNILKDSTALVTFFDALVHLDTEALETKKFHSNYWTVLVTRLIDWNKKSNWIHLFNSNPDIESVEQSYVYAEDFSRSSGMFQRHAILDSFFDVSVFIQIIKDYWVVVNSWLLLKRLLRVNPCGSSLNLLSLFYEEWRVSLIGPTALHNLTQLALFEKVLSLLPEQKIGFYISENQAWEIALIESWRSKNHGTLIAVPHSTVRYWDLRYFHDTRVYGDQSSKALPCPDYWAVNGEVAKRNFLFGGVPSRRVLEVEALRYLHLMDIDFKINFPRIKERKLQILICGDFLESTNKKIFSILENLSDNLRGEINFIFKPHPAFSSESCKETTILLTESGKPLKELLPSSDILICSTITSSAVEAYMVGVPVIQVQDCRSLNTSPLRGLKDIPSITTSDELQIILEYGIKSTKPGEPYFYLNKDLHRWKSIFSIIPPKISEFREKTG
jgi:surface carbohydrate biosynthesis protein (TIGR04326 family)